MVDAIFSAAEIGLLGSKYIPNFPIMFLLNGKFEQTILFCMKSASSGVAEKHSKFEGKKSYPYYYKNLDID